MNKIIYLSFAAAVIILPQFSSAETPAEIADKAVAQFAKLPHPSKTANAFEKWTYDISAMTIIHCWQTLNKVATAPKSLAEFRPTAAGTWSLSNDNKTQKLCQSLAEKGIKPVCTHATLWAKNVNRRTDLPIDYLQVHKNKPLEVEGVLGCYLNSDQIDKQSYAGPLLATWSEKPIKKSINLTNGPRILEAGTVMVTAPHTVGLSGGEYREPRLAVVISE